MQVFEISLIGKESDQQRWRDCDFLTKTRTKKGNIEDALGKLQVNIFGSLNTETAVRFLPFYILHKLGTSQKAWLKLTTRLTLRMPNNCELWDCIQECREMN